MEFWEVFGRWPEGPADERDERIHELEEMGRLLLHHDVSDGDRLGQDERESRRPVSPQQRRRYTYNFQIITCRGLGVIVGAAALLALSTFLRHRYLVCDGFRDDGKGWR
ncbi:hypothetical protein FHL15_006866 [Xylaria flabelliformis]|uniref:Uncharacterized protein n=1 Tax=Xylaria flabelliformis TaxID=2512241 RepID=A0A553HWB9_9PEZI|nr:hypothetical protein FHL15_006866 [Xylaria flabelliformis]